jgi:hypothetical protein
MVLILVIIGILVGLAIMSQPNDLSCCSGWLFILFVIVLFVVIATGAN